MMNMDNFKKQMGAIDEMMDYQYVELSEKDEPKLADWSVGKTYPIHLKAKLVAIMEDEEGLRGKFEVMSQGDEGDDNEENE